MRYKIILSALAASQYRRLPADLRSRVRDGMETHLRHEPQKISRSRIKRLRGLKRPEFRLRVDDMRLYYDVADGEVQILAILTKGEAQAWLANEGVS